MAQPPRAQGCDAWSKPQRSSGCRSRVSGRSRAAALRQQQQSRCRHQNKYVVVLCQRVETAPAETGLPPGKQPLQHSNGKTGHSRRAGSQDQQLCLVRLCIHAGALCRLPSIPTKSEVMLVRTDGKSCSRELVEGEA